MRKVVLIILSISIVLMSSCRMPREMVWDMVVMPFSGMDKEQVHNIDKFMPDCPHGQFEFDAQYNDSLKQNERYFLNSQSAQKGFYSLIQTRMYDSTGGIVGGYEICMGNAKFLEIFENVPIASKYEQVNENVNRNVCFKNDVQFVVASNQEKQLLLEETSEYDYTLMVIWPSSSRYYTKRHLRQVRQYVKHFGDDYRFRVIYVHLPLNGQNGSHQAEERAPQYSCEDLQYKACMAYRSNDFPAAYASYLALDSVDSIVYYYDLWQFYVSAEKVRDTVKSKELLFRLAENNGFERFSLNQKFFEEIGLRDRPYWPELDSLIGLAESKRCRPFADSLKVLRERDQAIRRNLQSEEQWKQMSVIDSLNTAQLKALIAQYGFPTWELVGREAANSAWLIAQHSQSFLPWYLQHYKQAVMDNNAERRSLAYMEDRYLTQQSRPQIYGTQLCTIDSVTYFFPIIDPKRVNQRRLLMDMGPIEDYLKAFSDKGLDSLKISPLSLDYLNNYYINNSNMYAFIEAYYQNKDVSQLPTFYWDGGPYPFPRDLEVLAGYVFEGNTTEAVKIAKKMVLCGKRLDEEWHLPQPLMDSVVACYDELRADYERMITKDDDQMLNAITSFDTLVKVLDNGFYPRYTIDAWNGHIKDLIAEKAKSLTADDYEAFFEWLYGQVAVGNYHLFDYNELYEEVKRRLLGE